MPDPSGEFADAGRSGTRARVRSGPAVTKLPTPVALTGAVGMNEVGRAEFTRQANGGSQWAGR